MAGKSSKVGRKKCKAPRAAQEPRHGPGLAPWLPGLIADAMRSVDLLGACKRAGISLFELHQIRNRNPEADAALAEVDELLTLAAVEQIRASAAAGDLRAVRALTDGTLARLLPALAAKGGPTDKWHAWLSCPCCKERVYAAGWVGPGGRTATSLHAPESAAARPHVHLANDQSLNKWIEALDRGETWAAEVITRRETQWPDSILEPLRQLAKGSTSPKTTPGATP